MSSNFSLFNAMDGSLIEINPSAFDQSLVLNLLFQDRVLVYDALFFNCPNLLIHLKRKRPGHPSLFEVACQRGLVVPAFRDGNIQCLKDSAEALKDNSPVYDQTDSSECRDRLIRAVDRGISSGATRPFLVPANAIVGEVYDRTVRALLQRDDPPEYIYDDAGRGGYFDRVWDRTARWRTEVIDIAGRKTIERRDLGMRRQEIYNALGRLLEISSGGDVNHHQLIAGCSDAEDKLAIETFLRWLAQCHFISQARAFDVSINFPVYHYDVDFILDTILRSPLDAPPPPQEGFRCEVLLPSFEKLAQADPTNLMAMRVELGTDYLASLTEWQIAPDTSKEEKVRNALRYYCEEISARYKDIPPRKVEVKLGNGVMPSLLEVALKVIDNNNLSLISCVTKFGMALYRTIVEMREEETRIQKKRSLEITLPINKQAVNGYM